MIKINCNFDSVFSMLNTTEELKEVANLICTNVKTAYDKRLNEITSEKVGIEATVELSAEPAVAPAAEQQEAPVKRGRKKAAAPASANNGKDAKSKMEKAKEIAAKMKQQKTEKKSEEKPAAKPAAKKEQKPQATTVTKVEAEKMAASGLVFQPYNERCWVLRGDTKPFKKMLKEEFKGVFNMFLTGGEGWVIRNDKVEDCAKALGLNVKTA